MKKKHVTIGLVCLLALALTSVSNAQVIINDQFDDGDPLTNTLGIGGDYDFEYFADPATEAGGIITMPGVVSPTANGRTVILSATDESFVANGVDPVTMSVTITDMFRNVG